MNLGEKFVVYFHKTAVLQTDDISKGIVVVIGLFELFSIEMPKKSNILKFILWKFMKVEVKLGLKIERLFRKFM